MPTFTLSFQQEGPLSETVWPDLERDDCIHLGEGSPAIGLAVLGSGMASGLPSIALRIDLPDGKTVIVETSARLFCLAADAIKARYPRLLDSH